MTRTAMILIGLLGVLPARAPGDETKPESPPAAGALIRSAEPGALAAAQPGPSPEPVGDSMPAVQSNRATPTPEVSQMSSEPKNIAKCGWGQAQFVWWPPA